MLWKVRLLVHRTDLVPRHQMTRVRLAHDLLDLVAHLGGCSHDHDAVVHEVGEGPVLEPTGEVGLAGRREHVQQALVALAARRVEELRRGVRRSDEEALQVLVVVALDLGHRATDEREQRDPCPERIAVLPVRLDPLPVTLHEPERVGDAELAAEPR